MTAADVIEAVRAVEASRHDDEVAHGTEDSLWELVLEAYAAGETSPDLAREALKTRNIRFSRWCA